MEAALVSLGAAIGARSDLSVPGSRHRAAGAWAAVAPRACGAIVAVGYDADSGQLTVCPESAAARARGPGHR